MKTTKTEQKQTPEDVLNWLRYCESSVSETGFRAEGAEDYAFVAGAQDSAEVLEILRKQKRPDTVQNEIMAKINVLKGLAAQTKNVASAVPVETGDDAMSELVNGTLAHYRKKLRLQRKELDCFEHTIKVGRSLMHFFVDMFDPTRPVLKCKRIPSFDFLLDPASVEYDLSDCRFVFMNKWLTEDEIKITFPGIDPLQIQSFDIADYGTFFWDDKTDLYRLVEGWYRKPAQFISYTNPISGLPERVTMAEFKAVVQALQAGVTLPDGSVLTLEMLGGDLKEQKVWADEYYYCIFSGGLELASGKSEYKFRGYPFSLCGAYKDDIENRWFGVVNQLKDSQRLANTMLRQLTHLLQTLPKGMPIFETGAVTNLDEYVERSSDPTFFLETNVGKFDKVRFEHQPPISPVYQNLYATYVESMKSISGIQNEMLGIEQSSRTPGVTVRARQETAMSGLYTLFDNYKEFRIRNTEILFGLIQQYVTMPELIRIEGMKGAQLIQINTQMNPQLQGFNDISAGVYDIEWEDTVQTGAARSAIASTLAEYSHNNPGSIPPDVILEYSDVPFSTKLAVRQYAQAQQEQALQAQQAQMMMQAKELDFKQQELDLKRLEIQLKYGFEEKKLEQQKKEGEMTNGNRGGTRSGGKG